MKNHLDNKVCIITGGAQGIGFATASAFVREGARVVLADVTDEAGERAVHKLRSQGGEVIYVHTDVSQKNEVEAMVEKTLQTFGRLDCAFNNAGIEGLQGDTATCTQANWDQVIAVNLTGVWLCMKYEIIQMLIQGHGSIVNTSSVAGVVGFQGIPAYTASKHGIIGLTKAAALEYAAQGIRVNAVCPGVIETDMVKRFTFDNPEQKEQLIQAEPVGRMGQPGEVAEAVVWLCSDASSFVTGTSLVVDGGMVAR